MAGVRGLQPTLPQRWGGQTHLPREQEPPSAGPAVLPRAQAAINIYTADSEHSALVSASGLEGQPAAHHLRQMRRRFLTIEFGAPQMIAAQMHYRASAHPL
jgi:hypothetical protein